ncbi:MAG: UDP-3-O-(3-hydroxymyristoyl)glucosamine N-acyltransferase [Candidatus Omnitrophica bacterium]|nr:UDP-3-O-(3-hydroxymyristoyl)glucosamine N-acyltransferase [Candidatus Omnitrophota bacterium]
MKTTLKEIAKLVDGTVIGDENIAITGISGIKEAKKGDLTFIANSKYLSLAETTNASAILTSEEIEAAPKSIIKTKNPSLAFAKLVSLLAPNEIKHPEGIHPAAIIGENVKLGRNVAVQAYAVIEDNARIGDGSIIYSGVYIGQHATVGKDVLIYPGAAIRERVIIGDRVIIHSGSVIGSDGFGFATVKGVHHKIPQIGTVVLEDDVEIGANVTIDRARFDKTVVGRGTKIDNLVQIAHNVIIGENSIVVAQTGISGSTVIGKEVILAGQSGMVGHITIGDNSVVAAQAGVTKSVPPNSKVSGYPAKPHRMAKRVNACVQRLPEMFREVKGLRKRVEELERENQKLKETV